MLVNIIVGICTVLMAAAGIFVYVEIERPSSHDKSKEFHTDTHDVTAGKK